MTTALLRHWLRPTSSHEPASIEPKAATASANDSSTLPLQRSVLSRACHAQDHHTSVSSVASPGLRVRRVIGFPCGWYYFIADDHVDILRRDTHAPSRASGNPSHIDRRPDDDDNQFAIAVGPSAQLQAPRASCAWGSRASEEPATLEAIAGAGAHARSRASRRSRRKAMDCRSRLSYSLLRKVRPAYEG